MASTRPRILFGCLIPTSHRKEVLMMTSYIQTGLRLVAAFFVFVTLLAAPAAAQVATGNITGRVAGAQGNGVPHASVTDRSRATGCSRPTSTNDVGEDL